MRYIARKRDDGSKQSLENHLKDVSNYSRNIIQDSDLNFSLLSKEQIEDVSRICALTHDFAKCTKYFQEYIQNEKKSSSKQSNHSKLSSLFCYYLLKNNYDSDISLIAMNIVSSHHTSLKNMEYFHREFNKEIIKEQVDSIDTKKVKSMYSNIDDNIGQQVDDFVEDISNNYEEQFYRGIKDDIYESEFTHEHFILAQFLLSVLVDSDRVNSSGVNYNNWTGVGDRSKIPKDIVDKYKTENIEQSSEIDELRETAYQNSDCKLKTIDSEHASLTLPTGAGKTFAGINAASKWKEENSRLIYSLPFLSILEQNYDEMAKILNANDIDPNDSSNLLRHDHKSQKYSHEKNFSNSQSRLLNDSWSSENIFTTFVQLINTILGNSSGHLTRFHKLNNSVIILDEVQSIPVRFWFPIGEQLRKLSEYLNTKVLIMTATNPEIIEAPNLVEKEKYFGEFDRVKYVNRTEEINSINSLAAEISKKDEKTMAIVNTINCAIELHRTLNEEHGMNPIFLSSNLPDKERKERIQKIEEEERNVVSTQLIEAGVDISVSHIYRDLSTMDSIVQAGGRCNRENEKDIGEVHIVELEDGDRRYSDYVYDSILLDTTKEVINKRDKKVDESEYNLKVIEDYYDKINSKKEKDKDGIVGKIINGNWSDVEINLIDEYDQVDIYVMAADDGELEEVRNLFDSKDLDITEKWKKFQNLKTEMYKNVVSVRSDSDLEKLEDIDYLGDVKKLPERKYHEIYGVVPDEISDNTPNLI